MNWEGAKEKFILGAAGIGTGLVAFIALQAWNLNANMATVMERLAGHEMRIQRLEVK